MIKGGGGGTVTGEGMSDRVINYSVILPLTTVKLTREPSIGHIVIIYNEVYKSVKYFGADQF